MIRCVRCKCLPESTIHMVDHPNPEIRVGAHAFVLDPAGYDCGLCLKQGQNMPIFLHPEINVWVEEDVFFLRGHVIPMCGYGHVGTRLFLAPGKISANMIAANTITSGQLVSIHQVKP